MPLRPNYTWSESTKAIQLCVPLKGHGKNEVDVFGEDRKISIILLLGRRHRSLNCSHTSINIRYSCSIRKHVTQLIIWYPSLHYRFSDNAATECYLKVSFPPYLLELDLHGCIDSGQSRARVEKGVLIIKARKKQDNIGTWGLVGTCADRKCDPEVRARRENSIKEELKREQEVSQPAGQAQERYAEGDYR